ncbi:hypothetical protein SSX86_016974 [Deinandra increscens subsp. villosa]|uniref:Large ribosomal subunit protein uL15/eL18 domain-containing protein n=1 Tax=Deinandra increscens subsp. villosa TaxID=3103831 RepID=A0AAP0GWC5_9ASTR
MDTLQLPKILVCTMEALQQDMVATHRPNSSYNHSSHSHRKSQNVEEGYGSATIVYNVFFPSLKITALRFTETARARIEKACGECLTFDQLAFVLLLHRTSYAFFI